MRLVTEAFPLFAGSPGILAALEFRHSGVSCCRHAPPAQHVPQRQRQNAQVQPEAAVLHLPDIQAEFLFPAECMAAIDLRPAGEPRPRLVASHLFWRVARQVADR